jgi:hypothetical protein
MYHPDDLDQAIQARQQRYRHQAYQDRREVRRWRQSIGSRLVRLGEALGGSQATPTS